MQKVDTVHGACSSKNLLAEIVDESMKIEGLWPACSFDLNPCDFMEHTRKMLCLILIILCLFSTTHCTIFRLIVRSGFRRSNFRHQASPRVSPRESTQRRKVELWAGNVREFCLNVDFHVTYRDLLHAVKLRHGTDGFTSPPKKGLLRISSP